MNPDSINTFLTIFATVVITAVTIVIAQYRRKAKELADAVLIANDKLSHVKKKLAVHKAVTAYRLKIIEKKLKVNK